MKKATLFLFVLVGALLVFTFMYAQTGNNSNVKFQYCEYTFTVSTLRDETTRSGEADYGNGKKETYKVFMDGLNSLGANGWELCTVYYKSWDYTNNYNEYGTRYVYTFKKKL